MTRGIGLALLLLALLGCSGEQSYAFEGEDNPSPVGIDEGNAPGEAPVDAKPRKAPRPVSLEAAGGDASSERYRMRFRVAAPIVVAGARDATAPKTRSTR